MTHPARRAPGASVVVGACVFAIHVAAAGGCRSGSTSSIPSAETSDASPGVVLDEYVGWYTSGGRDTTLLTWGAQGGLMMFGVRDTLFAQRFLPLGDDRFRCVRRGDSTLVRFTRDAGGRLAGYHPVGADSSSSFVARVAGGPYVPAEVRFGPDSSRLAGTVFAPTDDARHPAVVMIHGSGASTRDNAWYMTIVDALARRGIVVLLPDKRGSGQSDGEWETAGFDDFVSDALAGVSVLRRHPRSHPDRIGLVGISQGGRVAPMAVTDSVAFVVNVSGAAVPLDEQLRHETTQDLRQSGWPAFLRPLVRSITIRSIRRRQPEFWAEHGELDPLRYWDDIAVPALVVYGSEDEYDNVPVARSISRLRALGEPSIAIRVYEGSGHALYEPGTMRVREDFLVHLAEWIHRVAAEDAGRP